MNGDNKEKIVLHTNLTTEEIDENFMGFDFGSAMLQGLEEAIAYEKGQPMPGTIIDIVSVDEKTGEISRTRTVVEEEKQD
ncbi:MAG: hypothetical protein E7474_06600 [Ruminococcaceae bacterium]|nr:hypothetical protein [Oscillospiraceae bacterium]